MKALAFSLVLVAGSGMALAAAAQAPAPAAPAAQPPIVLQIAETTGKAKLKVSSADVKDGVLIPNDNSAYGKSLSPQVTWSKVAGAKSYAVLLEDSDANARGMPITHWLAFNIPATATSLAGGLPPQGAAAVPAGMVFGNNIAGKPAYFGPRTPPMATHHYHLEVVALDTVLPLTEGAPRNAFVDAAKGHVLASGEVVGLFTGPAAAPAAAPAAK